MTGQITLTGMVLSSMPVGEYDRRIVLLTKERGKVSAFARGARRPKSSLVAATNPFVSGDFEAFEGRDSYTIHSASIKNYFAELTSDISLVWYGYYFLEIADYFSLENNDETQRLILLYQAFRALLMEQFDPEFVRSVYEFKTLVINGEYPDVFRCGGCGREDGLEYISIEGRHVICNDCHSRLNGHPISASVLYALQYIAATPPAKLFSFKMSEAAAEEFGSLVREYYKSFVKREFKSEEFLDL